MTPKDLERYWDRQAGTYDRNTAGVERRFLAASRRWVCQRAQGATLEIAVGTGANLPYYPDDVALTGIDWSAAMVQEARRRGNQLNRSIDLRQADATALPFPSRTFETVVSTFALCCIPDERGALAEMVRVLRPGGALLLADHVAASFWPLRVLQHLVEFVSVPLQGEHYTRRPMRTLHTLDVEVREAERLHLGAVERLSAVCPACR